MKITYTTWMIEDCAGEWHKVRIPDAFYSHRVIEAWPHAELFMYARSGFNVSTSGGLVYGPRWLYWSRSGGEFIALPRHVDDPSKCPRSAYAA